MYLYHSNISALPWFFGRTELRHSQATLGKQHGAQQYQTTSSDLWGAGGAFMSWSEGVFSSLHAAGPVLCCGNSESSST